MPRPQARTGIFAAEREGDFGPEDAGAAHFDPFAARFHVDDHVDARLGVRVERRFEFHAAEAHLRVELLQRAHQRGEVGFFVDDDAVDLVEHGQVLEADRFVAVGPADAEEFAGRVRVGGEGADRGGGGVRSEHDLLRNARGSRCSPSLRCRFPSRLRACGGRCSSKELGAMERGVGRHLQILVSLLPAPCSLLSPGSGAFAGSRM